MKIFDLHQDFMAHIRFRSEWDQEEQTSITQLRASDVSLLCATAFPLHLNDNHCDPVVNELITQELQMYKDLAQKEGILLVDKAKDLTDERLKMLLHLEGLNAFSGTIADWQRLELWISMGVRSIGTHWNVDNQLGGGTLTVTDGLTDLGLEVITCIEKSNLLLDLAHMGRQSFIDAAEIVTKPLYISHGNADALCSNVRNYTDAQLKQIGASGGVIGVFFANKFVVGDNKKGTVADVVNHITYIKDLIGIDHVALGSDFGGIATGTVDGLASVSQYPILLTALSQAGYTQEEQEKICWRNAERVIGEHLGAS